MNEEHFDTIVAELVDSLECAKEVLAQGNVREHEKWKILELSLKYTLECLSSKGHI